MVDTVVKHNELLQVAVSDKCKFITNKFLHHNSPVLAVLYVKHNKNFHNKTIKATRGDRKKEHVNGQRG